MPGEGDRSLVVDLSPLVTALEKAGGAVDTVSIAQDHPEVANLAQLLFQTVSTHGYCYLSNYGTPQSVVNRAFESSKNFFQLSQDVKKNYGRDPGVAHGWSGVGMEMFLNDRTYGDLKESFNFSPADKTKDMPTEIPDMGPSYADLVRHCQQLVNRVLDLMGVAMKLEDPRIMSRSHGKSGTKDSFSTFRSLRYPTGVALKEDQLSCGEHTDYGSVTLLWQDDVGGLQAKWKNGEYHDVPPIPGTVVLQMSDLMERWTADRIPATPHRVVLPSDAASRAPCRYSLVYFALPDNDTVIHCLDGSNKYPPVTAAGHVIGKLNRTSY